MSKRLTWALIEGEEQRAYAHTGQNRLEYLSGAASVRRYVEALEKDAAIWRAVREEDDLVSRLESVAMSWCLAGLADALDRVKPLSVRYGRMTDLADALKYAMGQQTTAGRMQVLTSLLDREPDGDTGADADE